LFNRARYNNSDASCNIYHKNISPNKKEIRISKQKECCSSITSTAEASRLKRILEKSPATIGYLKTARKPLNSCKTPISLKNTQTVEDHYIEESLDDQSIANISNPKRIEWAINSFKPSKFPGPDRFYPAQLQRTINTAFLVG